MSNPVAYLAGTWKQIDQDNIDKQLEAQGKLTLTRPLRRKLRISADSSLIRQKIGTFFI